MATDVCHANYCYVPINWRTGCATPIDKTVWWFEDMEARRSCSHLALKFVWLDPLTSGQLHVWVWMQPRHNGDAFSLFTLGFKICLGHLDHKWIAKTHLHLNMCLSCVSKLFSYLVFSDFVPVSLLTTALSDTVSGCISAKKICAKICLRPPQQVVWVIGSQCVFVAQDTFKKSSVKTKEGQLRSSQSDHIQRSTFF